MSEDINSSKQSPTLSAAASGATLSARDCQVSEDCIIVNEQVFKHFVRERKGVGVEGIGIGIAILQYVRRKDNCNIVGVHTVFRFILGYRDQALADMLHTTAIRIRNGVEHLFMLADTLRFVICQWNKLNIKKLD